MRIRYYLPVLKDIMASVVYAGLQPGFTLAQKFLKIVQIPCSHDSAHSIPCFYGVSEHMFASVSHSKHTRYSVKQLTSS